MKLTEKQKRFCDEYLIDLNATRAYKTVYPNCKRDETAAQAGSRLLRNVKVVECIKERQREREKRTEITQDWVLQELHKIAAVNGSDFSKVVRRKGVDMETGKPIEYDSVQFTPTDELPEEKRAAISAIKETKFGLSVESYDRVKALELLGRHLGIFTDKTEISGDLGLNIIVDYGEAENEDS